MSSALRRVSDVNGVRYELRRQLGRGGQGAVYEVDGGKLAAKVLFDSSRPRRDMLRNVLTRVRRLPLDDLEIARPLDVLREPDVGYVMELLTGMRPLKALAAVPKGTPSPASWYVDAGGLRRRLQLLARGADVLSALHGKGLIYTDPSPHNIFVSDCRDATEVRFIDADNIHYSSNASEPAVFTPGYGAPELLKCVTGANSLTDAHAFSVLAFETLALAHPLIGDDVANGPPEREEEALAGQLPWIDDPRDASNRSSCGVPRDRVLSPRLVDLAQRAFGIGLNTPTKRPGLAEWSKRLHAAGNATLACPSCAATFYFTEDQCPWCGGPRPAYAIAVFNIWDPAVVPGGGLLQKPGRKGRSDVVASFLVLTDGEPVLVTERLAQGRDGAGGNRPVVEMRLSGTRLSVRSLDGTQHRLRSPTGDRSTEVTDRLSEIQLRPGTASWRLQLGSPKSLHRVVHFVLRPKEAR